MAETAKIRVVVMYGGKADEHSISCISTAGVLRALDTDRFEPVPVGITKQGQWIVDGEDPRGWDMADGLPVVEKTPGSRDVVLDVALGQDGFFARNDDGQGLERGKLTWAIAYSQRVRTGPNGRQQRFTEEEIELLERKWAHFLRQDVEVILFNEDFFAAAVPELKELADALHIKVRR